MITISITPTTLSKSRQAKLEKLYYSRLNFIIPSLLLKLLIMLPLMRSFLFIVGIFNLPAIIALFISLLKPKYFTHEIQKTAKICLRIGMAKAVGGLLLACYMVFEYVYVLRDLKGNIDVFRNYLVYLGGSSLIDIVYSILAIFAVKKTKDIIKIMKKKNIRRRVTSEDISIGKNCEEDCQSCDSGCFSEEESSDKDSRSNC